MTIIRYLLAALAVLLLGMLSAVAQTNSPTAGADPAAAPGDLINKLTGIYGMLIIAAGWVTHANWPRLFDAYEWISAQGGWWGILCNITVGKKKIIAPLLLFAFALNAQAADFTNTVTFRALSTSTNIAVIPFAKYDLSTHELGYGAAGLYKVSDNFWTGLRIDRIDGRQTTAGVQAQLQQTFQINGFTFTPFVEASVGLGSTSLYGSAGPGAFIHLFHKDFKAQGHPVRLNIELIADFEHVVFDGKKSNQVNGGPILELDF